MASARPPLRAPRDHQHHKTSVSVNVGAVAVGLGRNANKGNGLPDGGSSARWSTSLAASPAPPDCTSIIPLVATSFAYNSSPPPGSISYFEPAAGSRSGTTDDSDEQQSNGQQRRQAKKPRKKRSGWGPYQSVLKERSVDFNLTLDVQNLKQEIANMEMFRNILVSTAMIQRHDPEGSLVRVAKNHYHVLRSGFNMTETGRKRQYKEEDQKNWIKSAFDPDVDVGNGTYGIPTLIEQIKLYSIFIKFVSMTWVGFEVIVAEDSVLVATRGMMHFQITRTTIASMFPHILSEEWLVSKLVGQEVHAQTTMDFYFNANGKVCRFQPDLDYVKTFIDILKDPRDVDILLGRALITDNCMIGLTNDDLPPPRTPPTAVVEATSGESEVDSRNSADVAFESDPYPVGFISEAEQQQRQCEVAVESPTTSETPITSAPAQQPTKKTSSAKKKQKKATTPATTDSAASVVEQQEQPGPLTPVDHFSHIVKQYFHVFRHGADSAASVSDLQRDFLLQHFSPTVGYGSAVGRQVLEDRWRSLCWCFGALRFRQLSQEPLAYTPMDNLYLIQSTAEYAMPITVRTVEQVFPHLFSDLALMDVIVGSTITVSAQLTFWLEKDTGLVASITEQMYFEEALARVVNNPDDLSFVLSRALPTLYGFVGEVVAAMETDNGSSTRKQSARAAPEVPEAPATSSTKKMSLANILG